MSRLRLLPEYAPQAGVIITWPHPGTDWRHDLEAIEAVYLNIARAVSRFERLLVLCRDTGHQRHIHTLLERAALPTAAVSFAVVPTNDTWVRDYGPLTILQDDRPVLHDFTFDGWGGKYPAELDNAVSLKLFTAGVFGAVDFLRHVLVLEGGSIDTDGAGTLLTTARCLLQSGRNPGFDRDALERQFRELAGIERVLWLEHGELSGDDTDGHIDMFARFCNPETIAYLQCSDPADSQYAELLAMQEELRGFRTLAGEPYTLVPLPLPQPVFNAAGERLPASYANFLIINGAVLVPVYDDPADAVALAALAPCFPGRELVAVNCRVLIQQYGSLHCATMQLPCGVLAGSA
jgi:agmatine/peptidylarginine deiminase